MTRRSRRGGGRGSSSRSRASKTPPALPPVPAVESPLDTFLEAAAAEPADTSEPPTFAAPEPIFAARVPPPEPERPLPATRRAIFFDVENSSRADHIGRVLEHLSVDRIGRVTEVMAVGNWRVIGHDTARLLARHGAHLVHSAPSVGVRDWSDLRIAVASGVWLAGARPGDSLEIISDDQAFDAVGDVAASLGVWFRRLSYRALLGGVVEAPVEEAAAEARPRRRRRGGRGRRPGGNGGTTSPVASVPDNGVLGIEPHTAPHDEIVEVVSELLAASPTRGVSIDALSNALKARGFRRTPGSPRLITRLRRIKEVVVSRTGMITLADSGVAEETAPWGVEAGYAGEGGAAGEPGPTASAGEADDPPAEGTEPAPRPRRRRRRGGRRRRGRGGSPSAVAAQ